MHIDKNSRFFKHKIFSGNKSNPKISFWCNISFQRMLEMPYFRIVFYYFGSHLRFKSRHFANLADLDWLTRRFQITHPNERICLVSCLYPEVHDSCHFLLHYFGFLKCHSLDDSSYEYHKHMLGMRNAEKSLTLLLLLLLLNRAPRIK